MSATSHPDIPLWIQNRIVGFFNNARNVGMILDGTIRDDPSDGAGNTIGPSLAARILREKNQLPRRRFTDFEQIDNIRGVGPGTVKDFVHSFGVSADAAFQRSMYAENVIFRENWPLEFFRYPFTDEESFQEIANDRENLRNFVIGKVQETAQSRDVSPAGQESMTVVLREAYLDHFSNSTPAAAYAFALWFYRFDADNWFSWERIQEQTIRYFEHNAKSYPWFMDFYLFKGFRNRGIIRPGISAKDLPVIVNWAEQTVTFWVSELYD